MHKSVLLHEVLEHLNCNETSIVLDCTTGCGGHASELLKIVSPKGMLIGIDADKDSIKKADQRLSAIRGNYKLVYKNFSEFDKVLKSLKIKAVDAMLFDLGISSLQLDDAGRGFSFKGDGPLDMRIDQAKGVPLYRALEKIPENQLGVIIRDFGEERYWRRIARAITEARRIAPVESPARLAEIITRVVGYRRGARINPSTRTFQALRIFINNELEMIEQAMLKVPDFLTKGARVVVISFHSLEDRIIKHTFKKLARDGVLRIITKKPLMPGDLELSENPRSRSAKLRCAERI